MDNTYTPNVKRKPLVSNESWVHEVFSQDDIQKDDVLDSRSVPEGTVIRTRKFGDYTLTKHSGDGQVWTCSHPELGDWTSVRAFEEMLIKSPSIPTGTIGQYYYICGSDGLWSIYKTASGFAVPQELACRFSDLEELQQAVHRHEGTAR